MSFPRSINFQPAPGIEGDFCDSNPRASVNAGPYGLIAGPTGAVVGRACWATAPNDADGAPASVTNSTTGTGPITGILHRNQQGLITTYLAEYGNLVQPGFPLALMKSGGYWVMNRGTAAVTKGMTVYAATADGSWAAAASGTTLTGYVATKFIAMSAANVGEVFKISSQPEG